MSRVVEKLANKPANKWCKSLWGKMVDKSGLVRFTHVFGDLHISFPYDFHSNFHMNFREFFPVSGRFSIIST